MTTQQADEGSLTLGYRTLMLAVIYRAVMDARKGDRSAREWLLIDGREWAELLDLPRWPPKIETRC